MSKTKSMERRRTRLKTRFQKERRAWKRAHPVEAAEKMYEIAVDREKRAIIREERAEAKAERIERKRQRREARRTEAILRDSQRTLAVGAIRSEIRKTRKEWTPTPMMKKASLWSRLFRRSKKV